MATEQTPTQWIDTQVQHQIGANKRRKSAGIVRSRRQEDNRDRPLNVLGCMALVHAVRTAGSGNRAGVTARRATTA
jgi:hypothetical protein